LTVVVGVKLPDVPVMITVVGPPVAAELLAASVSVLVPVTSTVLGLNVAVTPLGSPLAVKFTLPVKPFAGVTVIVLVPLPPCATLTELGEADNV
jgi:hypothetical protein